MYRVSVLSRVVVSFCFLFLVGLVFISSDDAQARITRSSTRFFCHRGFASEYPENSKIAQEVSLQKGFIGTNCDVWPTAKDENGDFDIAVSHDESLSAMTDSNKKVTELTADEIKKLRITKGINADKYTDQYVMMLDEILELTSRYGAFIQIEMKGNWNDEQMRLLIDKLSERHFSGRTVIESMHVDDLKTLKKLAEEASLEIETNLVVTSRMKSAVKRAKKCVKNGFTTVVCYYTHIDKKLSDFCHKKNIKLSGYVPVDVKSKPVVSKLLKYDLYSFGVSDIPWDSEPDIVPLEGAFNARELGGYKTSDGRKVKKKKLIRSGELAYLTDGDVDSLTKAYGLKKVFDLRYPSDVVSCPDRQIEGVQNIYLQMRAESNNAASDALNRFALFSEKLSGGVAAFRGACIERSSLQKRSYFEGMISGEFALASYKKVLEELLSLGDGESALFHCVYGKDRAGMMTAVVLMALGVPEKTICDDFAYSNTTVHSAGFDKQVVRYSDMEYVISQIKKRYGSIEKYITDTIGFPKSDVDVLRDKFLE